MSQQSEQVEADAEDRFTSESVAEWFEEFYHLPALAVVMGFMIWVRLQVRNRFMPSATGADQILFSGNDAYYHLREVRYTVHNWPFTMPYDTFTGFPYGTSVGQFGTLYDQVVATAALVVGLGDPTTRDIAMTLLVAPAVIGALVAVPVYFMGKRLHSRPAGLFGAVLLAILPGTFLQRSTVGFADHHVAEALMMTTAIVGVMVALGVAERELPVYEQLLDRDWEGLWPSVKWSIVAGLGIALYLWVWPPGIVAVGIVGVFFAVAIPVEVVRGRSPDHLALVATVSMVVVSLGSLVKVETLSLNSTIFSPVHILVPLGVAAGSVFLVALARTWEDRGIQRRAYPAAVLGIALVGLGVLRVVLPQFLNYLVRQSERAFGFGQSATSLTISEAQPTPGVDPFQLERLTSFLYQEYALTYVVAAFGVVLLLVHLYYSDDYRSELLLVAIWTVFMFLMALTQVRFHYYLAPAVAAVNAFVFGLVVDVVGVPDVTERIGDIKGYQVLTLLAVFVLIIAPLAPPLAPSSGAVAQQQGSPQWVVEAGKATAPSGIAWAQSGDWMQSNTPEEGTYGGADNRMQPYGTYAKPGDGDFEYPEGAYGVMSWWDYGHWITVTSERIPHANPFQENARSASSFLQAASETRANLILEAIPSMQGDLNRIDEMSNEELRAVVANQSDQEAGEDIRYVMIDDETASSKFSAVTDWADPPGSDYTRSALYDDNQSVQVSNSRYDQTMVSKLYLEDANGLSHYRLVHEVDRYSLVGGVTNSQYSDSAALLTMSTRPFNLVFPGWNSQLGNLSRQLTVSEARNRTVPLGGIASRLQGLRMYDASVESTLKTFERVPGAQVTGQLNGTNVSDRQVFLVLNLETSTGRSFRYVKEASVGPDGRFTATVPYATDDTVGPAEGGTNTSVEAVGNYSVIVGFQPLTQVEVPETAVYDNETVDVGTVDIPQQSQGSNGESGGNQTDGNQTDGNQTDGNQTDGNQTDGGNQSGSLTAVLGAGSADAPLSTADAATVAPTGGSPLVAPARDR